MTIFDRQTETDRAYKEKLSVDVIGCATQSVFVVLCFGAWKKEAFTIEIGATTRINDMPFLYYFRLLCVFFFGMPFGVVGFSGISFW